MEIGLLADAVLLIFALFPRVGVPFGQWPMDRRSLAQADIFGALARQFGGTTLAAEQVPGSLETWQHLPSRLGLSKSQKMRQK